jgi:hypothetical protein
MVLKWVAKTGMFGCRGHCMQQPNAACSGLKAHAAAQRRMRRTKGACSGMKTRATIEERVQQSNALVKVPGEVKE